MVNAPSLRIALYWIASWWESNQQAGRISQSNMNSGLATVFAIAAAAVAAASAAVVAINSAAAAVVAASLVPES